MPIKLTKVDERREAFRIILQGSVIDELSQYGEAYAEQHGHVLEPCKLLALMAEGFMLEDKAFQRWKKHAREDGVERNSSKDSIGRLSTQEASP